MKDIKIEPQYTIEVLARGVLVRGIPVSHFGYLTEFAKRLGYDILDPGVGFALGGMLFSNREGLARIRENIDEQAATIAGKDRELAWTLGWDSGASSLSIMLALGTSESAKREAKHRLRTMAKAAPVDADDWGRCFRLLKQFPHMEENFSERICEAYPSWVPAMSELQKRRTEYALGNEPVSDR